MKTRKKLWIACMCLLSAALIAMSLRAPSKQALPAQPSTDRAPLAPTAVYVATAATPAAIATAMMLDADLSPAQRVSPAQQRNSSPLLPEVKQFTLTPPNPSQKIYKTALSVQFAEAGAAKLPSQLPMTLGNQHVILERSVDDPSVFSTTLSFDWNSFIQQQQRRKDASKAGRLAPVFAGRDLVRMEPMQFLDPADIERALQSHQPIQFSPQMLTGGVANVFPDHELMMLSLPVVEDTEMGSGRTYDPCITTGSQGNPQGAWTFNTLMLAIANTSSEQTAEEMLNGFLTTWQTNQAINGFPASFVPARPGIGTLGGSGLLGNWPLDGSLPSLQNAPVRLTAIVNRIDLAGQPGENQAGELRFIFGVSAGTGTAASGNGPCAGGSGKGPLFNIIFEYKVPEAIDLQQWASDWNSLATLPLGPGFDAALQTLTGQVVQANSCVGEQTGPSCLLHIRTNEVELKDPHNPLNLWEQREFALMNGALHEIPVDMTPSNWFNGNEFNGVTYGQPPCAELPTGCSGTNTLGTWINGAESTIIQSMGTQPVVPDDFPMPGDPFLGGSAFNGGAMNGNANAYWNDPTISGTNGPLARRYFSLNTCDGCHGAETATLGFQQVVNRFPGSPSSISNFLAGCQNNNCNTSAQCTLSTPNLGNNGECMETVDDPVTQQPNLYGDIARRVSNLQQVLDSPSQSSGLLLPFIRPHIGVH